MSVSRTPERNTARTVRARDPTGPCRAVAGRLLTTASRGRAPSYDEGALAGGGALLSDGAAAGGLAIEPELSDGAAAGGAAGALLCEAGGAAAGSVLEPSFFAHAVSSSAAAASALRATFVFIDRYPDAC
jgi:hypothetical protein